jgi:hypothetical protein
MTEKAGQYCIVQVTWMLNACYYESITKIGDYWDRLGSIGIDWDRLVFNPYIFLPTLRLEFFFLTIKSSHRVCDCQETWGVNVFKFDPTRPDLRVRCHSASVHRPFLAHSSGATRDIKHGTAPKG